jgi:heptosyltransferase-3
MKRDSEFAGRNARRREIKTEMLLVRLGGLGDLLVILPSLQLLRRVFPLSRFTLVGRADYGLLLKRTGLVEEVWDAGSSRLAALFSGEGRPDPELEAWLKHFDQVWVWSLRESGSDYKKALKRQGARSLQVLGPPSGPSQPLFQHYFDRTADALGVKKASCGESEAFLRLSSPEWRTAAEKIESPAAIIHPGSGSRKKCWPLDRFLAVAGRLSEKNLSGVVVTGEADAWLEPELRKYRFPHGWDWVLHPPLILLASWLSACRVYLGNDSGITHLAAACGARVLALFRREAVPLWRPCGRVTLLSAEEVADIGTDRVWRPLLHMVECKLSYPS